MCGGAKYLRYILAAAIMKIMSRRFIYTNSRKPKEDDIVPMIWARGVYRDRRYSHAEAHCREDMGKLLPWQTGSLAGSSKGTSLVLRHDEATLQGIVSTSRNDNTINKN